MIRSKLTYGPGQYPKDMRYGTIRHGLDTRLFAICQTDEDAHRHSDMWGGFVLPVRRGFMVIASSSNENANELLHQIEQARRRSK